MSVRATKSFKRQLLHKTSKCIKLKNWANLLELLTDMSPPTPCRMK